MEENSARWLAVREACRRILTEEGLILNIPQDHVASWHRLILNMADSMPQRLEFPEIVAWTVFCCQKRPKLFDFQTDVPSDETALWLPFDVQELITDFIQMCSELLLAGYPGCSGCGYRDDEEKWNELAHRNRIKNSINSSDNISYLFVFQVWRAFKYSRQTH